MPIRALPGFPETQIAYEYCVGAAQKAFEYPGILQCLSLTGHHVAGLLGTHISPGATKADMDDTFGILRSGGGANYLAWYVVGNFQKHFVYTKVGWTSKANIAKALRGYLNKNANFYVFDTTELAKIHGSGLGIDIHATHAASGVDFAYARAGGKKPKPTTAIAFADFSRI